MTYYKNVTFMIICFFCLLLSADGAKNDYEGLKRIVDILVDSVLEFRLEVRSLKDAVSILQQQMNTIEEEHAGQVPLFSENLSRPMDISDIVYSLSNDINAKMMTLQDGFNSEKANIRNTLRANFKIISDNLTSSRDLLFNTTQETMNTFTEHSALQESFNKLFLKSLGYSFYKYFNAEETWNGAQTVCRQGGGYLVEIKDESEYDFVLSLTGRQSVWLGATDQSREGHWRWAKSGSHINLELWEEGEPNDSDKNEDCLVVATFPGSNYRLNDVPCDLENKFVCEYEL